MKNLFGKFNIVDFVIVLGVIIALIVGVATTKHFRQTADKQIEATSPITFQVFLRGVTVTGEEFPIKSQDKTFITIRNVPYTELNVVKVTSQARQTAIAAPKVKEQYILAKITKDGAVVGGNKIKMGLPVTLEGESYKFNGTISDVRVTTESGVEDVGANNSVG